MEKKINKLNEDSVERLSIIIELLTIIWNCKYSDAFMIIENTKVYNNILAGDYGTTYESPQSNVSRIGEELRLSGNKLGYAVTDENIRLAVLSIRNRNLNSRNREYNA